MEGLKNETQIILRICVYIFFFDKKFFFTQYIPHLCTVKFYFGNIKNTGLLLLISLYINIFIVSSIFFFHI